MTYGDDFDNDDDLELNVDELNVDELNVDELNVDELNVGELNVGELSFNGDYDPRDYDDAHNTCAFDLHSDGNCGCPLL